jgi:membrane associated rhomboid family serine protease
MAFLQSLPPRQPVFRAPPVVMWLLALLVALHVARVIQPPLRSTFLLYAYGLVPARYGHAFLASHAATFWEQALPFVSHMGLHADFAHLALNCILLLAFGPVIARRFGAPLFLLFFLLCGLVGAGVSLAVNWGSSEPGIGASSAASGLMAAAVRMLPAQLPWAVPGEAPLAPLWSRPVLIYSLIWAVVIFISGLFSAGAEGMHGHFIWQAHMGAFLAGLLLASLFDWLRPRPLARSLGEG